MIALPNTENTFFERLADFLAPRLRERRIDAERRADTDALTGMANRAAFDRAQVSGSQDANMAFIIFDLNNFGKINKQCGHAFGDEVLRHYADVIGQAAKKFKCRAFRLSGDEFVILAPRRFAAVVRDAVENRSREFKFTGFAVSISGATGATLAGADSRLQARKAARKSAA